VNLDPVIRESVTWLSQRRDAFVMQLHTDIAALLVDVTNDGWPLCDRMVGTLLWVPVADQPTEAIASTLQWVGGQNRMEGFPGDKYVDVAHALLRTVRSLTGGYWTTPMGSAWISYFMSIQPHLVTGAEQAAAHPAVQEADRARFLDRQAQARERQVATGNVDLESVGNVLAEEDEEDDDAGYGQIMVSMTLKRPRREPHDHPARQRFRPDSPPAVT